jgi:hypothetical protein
VYAHLDEVFGAFAQVVLNQGNSDGIEKKPDVLNPFRDTRSG